MRHLITRDRLSAFGQARKHQQRDPLQYFNRLLGYFIADHFQLGDIGEVLGLRVSSRLPRHRAGCDPQVRVARRGSLPSRLRP